MSLYSKICIWLINLLLVFIVGNLIAFIVVPSNSLKDIDHADARVNNFIQALGDEKLQQLYPQRTPAQILELLSNQARAISVYQPFTQFRLPDYRSATFNSSTPGYRHIGNMQGPWPIADGAYNIFLFGGSTTMGSGVADDETVGAFLQTQLRALGGPKFSRANVYNFGTGAYFSTQERLAFEQIALSSTKPDIAIFIDGINDLIQWSGQPAFTPFLSSAAELLQQSWAFKGFGDLMAQSARKLPLVSLAYKLGAAQNAPTPFPQVDVDTSEFNDPARFKVAIDRYINNTRLATALVKFSKSQRCSFCSRLYSITTNDKKMCLI